MAERQLSSSTCKYKYLHYHHTYSLPSFAFPVIPLPILTSMKTGQMAVNRTPIDQLVVPA